jgi:hypothetical protein
MRLSNPTFKQIPPDPEIIVFIVHWLGLTGVNQANIRMEASILSKHGLVGLLMSKIVSWLRGKAAGLVSSEEG